MTLRRMLKDAGFEIVKVEEGTYACINLPSDEAEALFNSVVEKWRKEEKEEVYIQSEDRHVDWEKIGDSLRERFKRFPSQLPYIQIALDMLKARNNTLLIGPPGSGKSMLMDILMELLDAVYVNMPNMTNAGLENILPRLASADVLLLDARRDLVAARTTCRLLRASTRRARGICRWSYSWQTPPGEWWQ